MNNQHQKNPFGHEEASKILLNFAKNELLPMKGKLMDFFAEASIFRPNINMSFYRKGFKILENEYSRLTRESSELLKKYETPDIIFKGLDIPKGNKTELAYVMHTYFNFTPSIKPIIGDCLRLLEISDRILSNKRNTMDFKVSVILSIIAIVIALIA